MNPDSLRTDVLRCVASMEATGSAAYLNDADIAATINVELADVQRQMVILESSELLQLSKDVRADLRCAAHAEGNACDPAADAG